MAVSPWVFEVITDATEMPVPSAPFLIAMARADCSVYVQNGQLQPFAIDSLPAQIAQRAPLFSGEAEVLPPTS